MTHFSFRAELTEAVAAAFDALREGIGDERLYAFALYTSGEDDFCYICASANTEERLASEDARWSAPSWAYHDFSERVARLDLPESESEERDEAIYEDMIAALTALGAEREGVTLLIVCGDMSEEFFLRGLERLNPKSVVDAYVNGWTPAPFFETFEATPASDDPSVWVGLWRDLMLEGRSALADEARRSGVTSYDVEARIARLGGAAVPALIASIDAHTLAPACNAPDSEAWNRHGAITPESRLATSGALLIAKCGGASDADIGAIQRILAQRVAADMELEITSTLAENLARALHTLRPDHFPEPRLDPATNHLRNPRQFLP